MANPPETMLSILLRIGRQVVKIDNHLFDSGGVRLYQDLNNYPTFPFFERFLKKSDFLGAINSYKMIRETLTRYTFLYYNVDGK